MNSKCKKTLYSFLSRIDCSILQTSMIFSKRYILKTQDVYLIFLALSKPFEKSLKIRYLHIHEYSNRLFLFIWIVLVKLEHKVSRIPMCFFNLCFFIVIFRSNLKYNNPSYNISKFILYTPKYWNTWTYHQQRKIFLE